jgi:hypothetical protein
LGLVLASLLGIGVGMGVDHWRLKAAGGAR